MTVDIRELLRSKADEAAVAPPIPATTLSRARRRRLLSAVAAAATTAAAVVGAFAGVNALREDATPPISGGPRLVLSKRVHLDAHARDVALGHGSLWIQAEDSSRILRIDPATGRTLATITPGFDGQFEDGRPRPEPARLLSGLSVGEDAVWVVARGANVEDATVGGTGPRTSQTFTLRAEPIPTASTTTGASAQPSQQKPDQTWRPLRINPQTNEVEASNVYPLETWAASDAAAGAGAFWVVGGFGGEGTIHRFDTTAHTTIIDDIAGYPAQIVAEEAAIWVAVTGSGADSGHVVKIDPRTAKAIARYRLPIPGPLRIAVGEGVVWATAFHNETLRPPISLVRIDPGLGSTQVFPIRSTGLPRLEVAGGYVWNATGPRTITLFDAASGETRGRVTTRDDIMNFVADDRGLWIIEGIEGRTLTRYTLVD